MLSQINNQENEFFHIENMYESRTFTENVSSSYHWRSHVYARICIVWTQNMSIPYTSFAQRLSFFKQSGVTKIHKNSQLPKISLMGFHWIKKPLDLDSPNPKQLTTFEGMRDSDLKNQKSSRLAKSGAQIGGGAGYSPTLFTLPDHKAVTYK